MFDNIILSGNNNNKLINNLRQKSVFRGIRHFQQSIGQTMTAINRIRLFLAKSLNSSDTVPDSCQSSTRGTPSEIVRKASKWPFNRSG